MNVLITGAGSVLSQSITKALRLAYPEASILLTNSDPNYIPLGHLAKATYIVPEARETTYQAAILDIYMKENIDLIFGGTEHEIYALGELSHSLPIISLPNRIVDITTDKYLTSMFFDRYGLVQPETRLCTQERLEYPYIIKPRISSASRNVSVIRTKKEHKRALPIDLNQHVQYIMQEYLDGPEFTVGCYLDKISHKTSMIVMERTLGRDGASLIGKVIENQEIEKYCFEIMKALELTDLNWGPVNVQLRLTDKGPIAFELNGRFSSTEAARAHLGFNAVAAAVENYLYQRPYSKFAPIKSGKFCRYYEEVYSHG